MTDTTNGWRVQPGVPFNPEKDGWHWLAQKNQEFLEVWEWNAGPLGAVAEYGDQSIGAWLESEGDGQPEDMAKWYSYLGPCLTPDEVQNLRDDLASAERERAHQHGRADRNAAEHAREQAKREALQKRVAELERLVKILMDSDPWDYRAADNVTVLDVWRKEARVALEGKKE